MSHLVALCLLLLTPVPVIDTLALAQDSQPTRIARRDPFRPFTVNVRAPTRRRENLSPLERYELGQLKLVGVIWSSTEPKAIVEDATGLGYVVAVGTMIGPNDGVVKAIRRNEMIIEEHYEDVNGAKKGRTVSIKLAVE